MRLRAQSLLREEAFTTAIIKALTNSTLLSISTMQQVQLQIIIGEPSSYRAFKYRLPQTILHVQHLSAL